MRLTLSLLVIISFLDLLAQDEYVGEVFYGNAFQYIKVSYEDQWILRLPHLKRNQKFTITGNPTDSIWSTKVFDERWEFRRLDDKMMPITYSLTVNQDGLNRKCILFAKLQQEKLNDASLIGVYESENGSKIQIYERFDFLHIHSPFSKEIMALHQVLEDQYFTSSGELFYVEKRSSDPIQLICKNRNGQQINFVKSRPIQIKEAYKLIAGDSVYTRQYWPCNVRPNQTKSIMLLAGGKQDFDQHHAEAMLYCSYGYLVLLFNKPGVGLTKSKVNLVNSSFENKVDYYKEVLSWFQSHPMTNPDYIGIQGGSEEARLAMMMASDTSSHVAFVIGISTPMQSYLETRLFAINQYFNNKGFSTTDQLQMMNVWKVYLHEVSEGKISMELIKKINNLHRSYPDLYWPNAKHELPVRPKSDDVYSNTQSYMSSVACPLFLQYGGNDLVVNSVFANGLLESADYLNAKSKVMFYPQLDHSLMTNQQKIGKGIYDDRLNWLKTLP